MGRFEPYGPWLSLTVSGPRYASFAAAAKQIPGVREQARQQPPRFSIPENAVRVVAPLIEQWGMSIDAAYWPVPRPPAATWDEVRELLLVRGEIRPEYVDGFPQEHQRQGVAAFWNAPAGHFWVGTGGGKTWMGIVSATAVPGPVLFVTRSAARMQVAREIERFTTAKAFVLRAESAQKKEVRVNGLTWREFVQAKMPLLRDIKEVSRSWDLLKKRIGAETRYVEQTLPRYLLEAAEQGYRPWVVVGWESLLDHLEVITSLIQPRVLINDESHLGKNGRNFDVALLPPLPDDPVEAAHQRRAEYDDATERDGFIREDVDPESGLLQRRMFVPIESRATACRKIAREFCAKRIALTATPVYNRVSDLYGQLSAVEPNCWGSMSAFHLRYCLEPSTPVLMADGTYRPIGDVRVGDHVMGWSGARTEGSSDRPYRMLQPTRVVWTGRRVANTVRVFLEDGTVFRCTPDHHWLAGWTVRPHRLYQRVRLPGDDQLPRHERGLTQLVRLLHQPQAPILSDDYKFGYIRGLLDGDGHTRIIERRPGSLCYQTSVFSNELPHLERAERFAVELGLRTPGVRPRKNPDGWTLGFYSKGAYQLLHCTSRTSDDYGRGWLAGMYDAEGSGDMISQYAKVNPVYFEAIKTWLDRFGFDPLVVKDKGKGPVGWRFRGKAGLLRFVEFCRPVLVRKVLRLFQGAGVKDSGRRVPIKLVEPAGLTEVVSIQTEAGNYIAAGYGSKNCDAHPGAYGGMDTSGSSNLDELNLRLQGRTFVVPTHEAQKHMLHLKRRQSVYVTPEDQLAELPGVATALKQARKSGDGLSRLELERIVASSKKRGVVTSYLENHVNSAHKVVVFTARKRDCDDIGQRIQKARWSRHATRPTVWVTHGDMSIEARDAIVQEYMAHPGPCVLVATGQSLGESLNLDDTDAAMFIQLPYTPGELRQWEGRFFRLSTKRPVLIYYFIAEGTIDEQIAGILLDKLPAVGEISQDEELAAASDFLAGIDTTMSDEDFAAAVLASLDD